MSIRARLAVRRTRPLPVRPTSRIGGGPFIRSASVSVVYSMTTIILNRWKMAAGPLVLLLCAFGPQAKPVQSDIDQAASLLRHARDTQNPADFRQAGAAAAKALAADPQSFDAQRYQAMALLGQQDLATALDLASRLNKKSGDDIGIWAVLSEIHASRGDYEEAERCAQWVLDLRRNSPLGFSTAARLREVYGDDEGAVEFYSEALRRTPQSDVEERTWLLAQSARVLLREKNISGAAATLEQAEKLFPNSVQVMEQKAEVARVRGEFAAAADLLAKESQESPTAGHLYAYAQALDRAGKHDDARPIYEKLEAESPAGGSAVVLYYADRKKNPEKALALATNQISARQDTATLDAYAWALYRAGKFTEARTQIDRVLALGTRDREYVCHASRIAAQTRDIDSAAAHLPEGACEVIP
jgi:tetratricopeptide (TPR) repeat protein